MASKKVKYPHFCVGERQIRGMAAWYWATDLKARSQYYIWCKEKLEKVLKSKRELTTEISVKILIKLVEFQKSERDSIFS